MAADTIFSRLRGLIGRLPLRSDECLWVVPSQGIHTIGVFFPIDLVYLDRNHRVIYLVESFPAFHVGPRYTEAASVLQLPPHTIFASHTQLGDQLMIRKTSEMIKRVKENEPAAVGADSHF